MNTRFLFSKLKRRAAAAFSRTRGADAPRAAGGSRIGEVLGLAWPIVVAMLGDAAMGIIDTKLVGSLGPSALAGVGLAMTISFVGYTVIFGLERAVKIRTSHAVGERRPERGLASAAAGMVFGVGIGIVVLALTRDPTPLLALAGADAQIAPAAGEFLRAYSLGAPALGAMVALVQHRQGLGDSRTPMVTGLVANVVNAVLAWALIHGRLGLPELGVRGAGYATAIAITLQALALGALYVRDVRRAGGVSGVVAELREVASLGIPTGAQFGLEMLAFTTFTALLGTLGSHELAAHQIALSVLRACFLPGIAVAEAGSVLIGKALGARDLGEAERAVRSALAIAVGFMATTSVMLGLAGPVLARQFTSDADVIAVVSRLLWVAALFQALDAVTIVMRGALRAAKDVRVVALVGIACAWVCIPTAGLVLGRWLGWGAVGGWLGFVGETGLAAIILARRWKHGAWRKGFGPEPEPTPAMGTPRPA